MEASTTELSDTEISLVAFKTSAIGVDVTLVKMCADVLIKRAEAKNFLDGNHSHV